MNFVLLVVLYLFFSGCVSFYGRYGRSSVIDRPLILNSIFIQLILGIILLAFIVSTVVLLFIDWKIVIVSWIIMLIFRNKIEDISLLPFAFIYRLATKKK